MMWLLTAWWLGFQGSIPGVRVSKGRKQKCRAVLRTVTTLFPQSPVDESGQGARPDSRVWRNKRPLLTGSGKVALLKSMWDGSCGCSHFWKI